MMNSFWEANKLSMATLVALVLGIGVGMLMRVFGNCSQVCLQLIALPGDLYTRMLKMVVLPLIFPKLILAVTSLEGKLSGKLGALLMGIYILQNVVNQIFSVIAVFVIQPGVGSVNHIASNLSLVPQNVTTESSVTVGLVIIDLFKNMFPDNIVKSMIFQTKSVIVESEIEETEVGATNNLGMVVVSVTLGFALKATSETSSGIIGFLDGLATAFTKVIEWIVNFGPIGIWSLVFIRL